SRPRAARGGGRRVRLRRARDQAAARSRVRGSSVRSRRWIRKIGREGGLARARALTPQQRSKAARRAAVIRWRDIREIVRAAAKEPKPPPKREREARLKL